MRNLLRVDHKTTVLFLGLAFFASCSLKGKNEPPNTVHIPSVAKIKGLDPIYADDLYAGLEVGKVYEGLLQYHYLKRPYELIPNLAEAMPTVSSDGKTITAKIKKGVFFQDDACFKASGGKGRELVAEDFVYSFKRLADPKLVSGGWWVLDGKVVGLNEWRDQASKSGGADYSGIVEGIRALDSHTLQIKLVRPSAQFLYALAMPYTHVVPQEAVKLYGKEFINHAVGTGPFKLEEFGTGLKIVWNRNPTYRREVFPIEGAPGDKELGLLEEAGKPLPLADRLVVTVYQEQQPMWLNFMAGNLELAGIPKDNYQQAMTPNKELTPELKGKGIRLSTYPKLDLVKMSFNMANPILGKNKLLRQALSLAYSSDSFIDLFYNGRAIAAQGPIPPGIVGYDSAFKNPYRQFNLAKAKQLLAQAGYPDGKGLPTLEYLTLADSTSRQISEFDQKSFAALGISIKVSTFSWPEFITALKNKRGHIWSHAWGADYPDAENFLQLFYSKNMAPGPNDSNYSNSVYDQLYERSLLLADSPGRTELYKKMVAILVEDCPVIWVGHRLGFSLVQKWTKGYKYHDLDHGQSKYVRTEPSLKKQ